MTYKDKELRAVEIDFSDLTSICEAMDKHHETKSALMGTNSEGELTLVSIFEDCIVLTTYQKNHWCRKNYFYRDGTVEELFEGKWE